MNLPEIRVGDSFEMEVPSKTLHGKVISPGEGWQVKLLIKGGGNNYSSDLSADFNIAVTAIASSGLTAALANWAIIAIKDDAKKTMYEGSVKILPSLEAANGTHDGRSQAKKSLDAVDAAILALLTGGVMQEYQINGRSIKRYSIQELRELKKDLSRIVIEESDRAAAKNGKKKSRSVFVRF